MSTSSQLIQRVENAVYHEPYMIPILFKESKIKAGFLHSRLRRYVPHRIGIEFECFGEFANRYLKANNLDWKSWEDFESNFRLIDFSQDTSIEKGRMRSLSEFSIDSREEIRVSIQDYRQLNGLYNVLKEMAKYCSISEDCGIHIHVDLTKYDSPGQRDEAVKWFNKHLSEVESIFPRYLGGYNKRVAQRGKGAWVNLSSKGTVEFRIAPLTFDYEVLIVWIVKCCKLVSRMINECLVRKTIANGCSENNQGISINDYLTYIPADPPMGASSATQGLSSGRGLRSLRGGLAPEDYVRLEELVGHALYGELNRNQIEWYREGSDLILDYPDGERRFVNYQSALEVYLANGLDALLRMAPRESLVEERQSIESELNNLHSLLDAATNSTNNVGYTLTTGSSWISTSLNYCAY